MSYYNARTLMNKQPNKAFRLIEKRIQKIFSNGTSVSSLVFQSVSMATCKIRQRNTIFKVVVIATILSVTLLYRDTKEHDLP